MWIKLIRFYQFLCFLVNRFYEDRCTQNAGSLTYTTLFAIVPILTVLFVMLAGIPAFQGVGEQIQLFIFKNFIPATGDIVQEYLQGFIVQAKQLTWIGVIFLIVTTFMMLITIEQAFNNIWRVQKERAGLQRFLYYWALLSLGPILLGGAVLTSTYVMSLSFISGADALPLISTMVKYTPFALGILGFTLLYYTVPNTRVPFKHALISGIFTTFLLDTARWSFTLYVKMFPSYQLIYGAFAVVPLFLLWIYVSWMIVLIGCELCCCLGLRRYLYNKTTPDLLVALGIIKVFYDAQLAGRTVTSREIQQAGWSLPEDEWMQIFNFFQEQKLICSVNNSDWALCRDIHEYSFYEFIRQSPWPLPTLERLTQQMYLTPWLIRIKPALVSVEAAQQEAFAGSLAAWLDTSKPLLELPKPPETKTEFPTTD